MLHTERLLLRQWTEADFAPFAALCSDPEVMEFFPNTLTREESDKQASKALSLIERRGWGFWAVEIPDRHKFIGFVGLHIPDEQMPFSPCVEIGWRLSKEYWGKGYATEAALASLEYAFATLDLMEVVSFTAVANIRSQAVMKKIGMHNSDSNFRHPGINASHPLCEHVLYKIGKSEWQSR